MIQRKPGGIFFITRVLPVLVLFSFISPTVDAQLSQPLRYECEHKSGSYNYTVLSMNENGIALFHQIDKFEGNNHFWQVELLDSALQKTWETEIELSNQLNLIGYDYINDAVYFLFKMGSGDQGALHLYEIHVQDHVMRKFEIETKLDFKLAYFNIIGSSAVLGGYVSRQPALFLHELKTGRSKVVPGFFLKNTELLDVRANHNGTFNTVVMDRSSTEKKQIIVKTFDETGALILDDAIEVDINKTLLTGVTSTLIRDELLVTGTWGLPNGKIAMGLYTVTVDPFSKQLIQYYDFTEFQHFMDYMKPRKAAKIKAKTERRKKNGKLPAWGCFVNTARLVENEHGFILLSEVYNPMSSQNSYNSPGYTTSPYAYGGGMPGYGYGSGYGGYNPYGFNSYNQRYSPYSPYGFGNYSHRTDINVKYSWVSIFDREGKLVEDTGMKTGYVHLPSLDQLSDFICTDKSIEQIYRDEKEIIVSTTSRGPERSVVRASNKVRLNNPDAVLRSEDNDEGALRHWFGSYFFVWGYQSIHENDGSGNRVVFYVNKLKIG